MCGVRDQRISCDKKLQTENQNELPHTIHETVTKKFSAFFATIPAA
jgi:hypothetical protein